MAERVKKSPPLGLRAAAQETPLTLSITKRYLRKLFYAQIPSVSDIINRIELRCDYKAVTYEMLKDETFLKQVRKLFPDENWYQPFDEILVAENVGNNYRKGFKVKMGGSKKTKSTW